MNLQRCRRQTPGKKVMADTKIEDPNKLSEKEKRTDILESVQMDLSLLIRQMLRI